MESWRGVHIARHQKFSCGHRIIPVSYPLPGTEAMQHNTVHPQDGLTSSLKRATLPPPPLMQTQKRAVGRVWLRRLYLLRWILISKSSSSRAQELEEVVATDMTSKNIPQVPKRVPGQEMR
ncbi:uncharacterized protein LOC143022119 [Oratosquilla oratoria]|uniref:uncharacterized protein LOC143022119 n=1 Tax=Oratosquilla oratoria TaxID=337810 RepID=UPI003F76DA44